MLGTARAYIFASGMFSGVAQTEPGLGEPERNVEACLARLEEAGAAGCDLLVFPECATSGYMFASEDEAAPYAEEVPGPSVEALAGACARHRLHCVAGLLERDGDRLRNTAVLVGPSGLVGRYRKTHLPFLGGAELVVHPTNWPTAVKPFADFLTRARAAENRIFLLTANRVGAEGGVEFFGRSQIVDPLGNRLVEAGEGADELVVAEIEPAEAREKDRAIVPGEYEVHLFGDRRPELYGALVEEMCPVHVP